MKAFDKLRSSINDMFDTAFDGEYGSAWEAEPLIGPMVIAIDPDSTEYTVDETSAREHFNTISRLARTELETQNLAEAMRRATGNLLNND